MPDNYLLTGPNGSVLNLGSWLMADPGPRFGAGGITENVYTRNAFSEGGRFNFQKANVRKMEFPMLLASHTSWGSMDALSRTIRRYAQNGGYIDLMPDGTATADAVRFDILGGDVDQDYQVFVHKAGRMAVNLALETQPFGYSPTWIVIASSGIPSIQGPVGQATVNGASIIGDVPGEARIIISPTFSQSDNFRMYDVVAWSLAGRPSFQAFWGAASFFASSMSPATQNTAVTFMQGSTSKTVWPSPTQSDWQVMVTMTIPNALAPAYSGAHRLFGFFRTFGATYNNAPILLSADVISGFATTAPMASAARIATIADTNSNQSAGSFEMRDMGVMNIPFPSGYSNDVTIRLWMANGTSIGAPSARVDIGGVGLLPLDGPAGILPRGLYPYGPNIGKYNTPNPKLFIDGAENQIIVGSATHSLPSVAPLFDVADKYRGGFPRVDPSTTSLVLITAARYPGDYDRERQIAVNGPKAWANYHLQEAATPTAVDSSTNVRHGTYIGLGPVTFQATAGWGATTNKCIVTTGTTAILASGFNNGAAANSFAVEFWARRNRLNHTERVVTQGIASVCRFLSIGFSTQGNNSAYFNFLGTGATEMIASYSANDYNWHHWAFTYNATAELKTIYKDGVPIATQTTEGSGYIGSGLICIGGTGFGGTGFAGYLDDVTLWSNTVLTADHVMTRYMQAYGPTAIPEVTGVQYSAFEVRYRPRFSFVK